MVRITRRTGIVPLSIFCVVLALEAGASTPTFLPTVTYDSVGNFAIAVAAADLNGDGHPDLAVANEFSTNIGILLNNGDGTFHPAVSRALDGLFAQSVAIADLDDDSRPDLVVAVRCLNGGDCSGLVEVLFGNGDGTFRAPVSYRTGGESAWSVTVADLNVDGHPDLVVLNEVSNTVGVLPGDGRGDFGAAVTFDSGGQSPRSVLVRDVNADGQPDVILVNNCTGISGCLTPGSVSVLLGAGNGRLLPAVSYPTGGFSTLGLAVADLNGDGLLDLAVSNACRTESTCNAGTVGVLIGGGDGSFGQVVSYDASGFGTRSVAVADVNEDGRPDLVVASQCAAGSNCTSGTIAVLQGNGDGTFQIAVNYPSGGFGAESAVAADVNDDGHLDVVVANDGCASGCGGAVGVLLNNAQVLAVRIDIEPGNARNRVLPRSHQPLRLAVLATDAFDVTRIDVGTVRFGPTMATAIHAALRDVDGDGRLDAVFTFRTNRTGIACGDSTASLIGATDDGARFKGTDSIVTIGCGHHHSSAADTLH